MEKIIKFTPAYDKRDPDPNKNYGVHGVGLLFVLKGKRGTVQFLIYTNWHLPHVQTQFDNKPPSKFPYLFHKPVPADLGYHSPKPTYKGQEVTTDSCQLLDGKPCYYDGSTLNAESVFKTLLTRGSEGVWTELEDYYKTIFAKLE